MTAATLAQLQGLYIAYFGRAADPAGLQYWASEGISPKGFAAVQYAQPEFAAANAGLSTSLQINNLYVNLFGHPADAAGLNYWIGQINSGKIELAEIGIYLYEGALGTDRTTRDAKVAAAQTFTADVKASTQAQLAYNPESWSPWVNGSAFDQAKLFMAGVNANNKPGPIEIQAVVDSIAAGGAAGPSYSLTTGLDTISITTAGTTNVVNGIVGVPGFEVKGTADSTWTPGDSVTGNNLTKVNLTVTQSATDVYPEAAYGTINDVAQVNLTNGGFDGTDNSIIFNTSSWGSVGSINLVGGADANFHAEFQSLEVGTDLSVSGVAGTIDALYKNGVDAELTSDSLGSISYTDGNVIGKAAENETLSAYFTSDLANQPISLKDVTFTGAKASSVDFLVTTAGKNSPITVGNISQIGFNTSYVQIISGGDTSAITTGDYTAVSSGDQSIIDLNVYADGNKEKNIKLGNLSATSAGEDSSIAIDVHSSNNIDAPSDILIGTVSLSLSNIVDVNTADFRVHNGEALNGDPVSSQSGKTTVGKITVAIGNSDPANGIAGSADVCSSADWEKATDVVSTGLIAVGGASVTLGKDTSYAVSAKNEANASTGPATSGGITYGDITSTTGVNSALNVDVLNSAVATGALGTANSGNLAVGKVTATTGNYGSYTANFQNLADSAVAKASTVGSTSLGDISAVVGVNGTSSIATQVALDGFSSVKGSAGAISVGSITAATSGQFTYTTEASATESIGTNTIGNVSLTANALGATNDVSSTLEAVNGSLGAATVGNVSLNASAEAAQNTFAISQTAKANNGDLTVGTVNVSSVGTSTWGSVTINHTKTALDKKDVSLGATTVGNTTLTAKGQDAYSGLLVSVQNDETTFNTTGVLSVGSLTLNVGNDAGARNALVDVQLTNSSDDVKVGDIVLTGTTITDTTIGAANQDYFANVLLDSSAGVGANAIIGNVKVSGGDTLLDNFATLDFGNPADSWLDASAGAGGKITIGNIDYSGYATGATVATGQNVTIDVSLATGAATIIGSVQDDTITDNKGTNSITGLAGVDEFQFVSANKNLTLATADVITDWKGADDLIGVQSVSAFSYGEGTNQVSFAQFLTDAGAADAQVYVGQLAEGLCVALDFDSNGSVDSLVLLKGVQGLANVADTNFYQF